jgi:glycosyltransferase involved in cell wall biosynthesis
MLSSALNSIGKMEANMKFTVLVCTYQTSIEDVTYTLNSIIPQSIKDEIEIVICDDGSEISLERYYEEFFKANEFDNYRLILSSQNRGTVRNIINGLNVAKGKYVKVIGAGDAIANNKAIIFDNKKEGSYSYTDSYAFPVKIEYSVLNDTFRISAYRPDQNRFFKMTLETMSNIRLGTECRDTLQEDYKKFLAGNKKTVVLDVEPANHVIERCFRLFSYYERKAVYDREDRRYRLEIVYYSYDEAEVVRDILSLGSSVIVLEPVELRKKIYERILAANELYTCQK